MTEQTAKRIAKNLDWIFFAIILNAIVTLSNGCRDDVADVAVRHYSPDK